MDAPILFIFLPLVNIIASSSSLELLLNKGNTIAPPWWLQDTNWIYVDPCVVGLSILR